MPDVLPAVIVATRLPGRSSGPVIFPVAVAASAVVTVWLWSRRQTALVNIHRATIRPSTPLGIRQPEWPGSPPPGKPWKCQGKWDFAEIIPASLTALSKPDNVGWHKDNHQDDAKVHQSRWKNNRQQAEHWTATTKSRSESGSRFKDRIGKSKSRFKL